MTIRKENWYVYCRLKGWPYHQMVSDFYTQYPEYLTGVVDNHFSLEHWAGVFVYPTGEIVLEIDDCYLGDPNVWVFVLFDFSIFY